MKNAAEVLIVGAGMVGLAAANLLARDARLSVTVVDAGERPAFSIENDVSLRVSAIAPGSSKLLSSIGAWNDITKMRVCPYTEMKVWDVAGHADGPETLSFDAAEFALPELGFIVENLAIQAALLQQLETTSATIYFETKIDSIRRSGDRYDVELETARKLKPDLLIGADGAKSFVRSCAEIPVRLWEHRQKAFVTHLRPDLSHRNTAWQRFVNAGPIGLLPLEDGRVSCVWSTTPENADEALAMTDEQLANRLTDVSDGVLGRLTPAGPRGAFPLESQHAEHYVTAGLALVGDAAHAIHPLAGQGVNLGFADAAQLAETIFAELDRGECVGDLPSLRKYERARIGANQLMLSFVDGLNRLFSSDSASIAKARGAGMYAFNKSGPIRNHAVQVALGIR
ncbi:MAG: UbiH/UbiF/VisC/COQ6 family ubiquinone biosynthesis hydroxylase [Woeseiaceae bacterium]